MLLRQPSIHTRGSSSRPCPIVPQRRHISRRGRVSCRVGPSKDREPNDPFYNLFKSKLFQENSQSRQDFDRMINDLMGLSQMVSKFAEFDVEGKRMYLERMRDGTERYEVGGLSSHALIFIKRLQLADDSAAKEFLRSTNAQMLEGGFTLQDMFSGLKGSLGQFESWVAGEEAAIAAGPQQHVEFLKALKQHWANTALGAIDMGSLAQQLPPEVLMAAQADPKFWVAIKEISADPSPAVLTKWLESPTIGPVVAEMARTMLNRQNKAQ